ncbi:unnamed protein product [Cyclocybe aegerita]|uniref:Protein kinase domain-containing protein n=1 Tax=Cyclocybe aegerita TaxID=1973307 RepID=A0A8S0WRY3_CYCAE|nr:unnamed protein product [Cyclocybe aegerita]
MVTKRHVGTWMTQFLPPSWCGSFLVVGSCVDSTVTLQHKTGAGSTGCVYGAKLDVYGQNPLSYAIKTVEKGGSDVTNRISRLNQETKVYQVLGQETNKLTWCRAAMVYMKQMQLWR